MINQPFTHNNQIPQPPFTKPITPSNNDPYTLKINDTTVRLHFNGTGTLTTHIANAFNSMTS